MQETQVQSLGGGDPQRRKWQPAPVFLPGKSHGQWSLVGYSPWGHKELDTRLVTKQQQLQPMPEGLFSCAFMCLRTPVSRLPCKLPSMIPVLCAPLTSTAQGHSLALKPGWRLFSRRSQKSGFYPRRATEDASEWSPLGFGPESAMEPRQNIGCADSSNKR